MHACKDPPPDQFALSFNLWDILYCRKTALRPLLLLCKVKNILCQHIEAIKVMCISFLKMTRIFVFGLRVRGSFFVRESLEGPFYGLSVRLPSERLTPVTELCAPQKTTYLLSFVAVVVVGKRNITFWWIDWFFYFFSFFLESNIADRIIKVDDIIIVGCGQFFPRLEWRQSR